MPLNSALPSDFDFQAYNEWLEETTPSYEDSIVLDHEAREHYLTLLQLSPS